MQGYVKIIFCLMLVSGLLSIGLPVAFSQEIETVSPKEIFGKIVSVDLEKSVVVIKQLKDAESQIYEDVTINLDKSTKIDKDYETAGLSALTAGAEATIQYQTDNEGKNIALYILVESSEE